MVTMVMIGDVAALVALRQVPCLARPLPRSGRVGSLYTLTLASVAIAGQVAACSVPRLYPQAPQAIPGARDLEAPP